MQIVRPFPRSSSHFCHIELTPLLLLPADPVHNRVLSHAASAVPANVRLPETDRGPPHAECRPIHLHVQHVLRAKLPAEVVRCGRSTRRRSQQQPSGLQTKGSVVAGGGIGQSDGQRTAQQERSVTGPSRRSIIELGGHWGESEYRRASRGSDDRAEMRRY